MKSTKSWIKSKKHYCWRYDINGSTKSFKTTQWK